MPSAPAHSMHRRLRSSPGTPTNSRAVPTRRDSSASLPRFDRIVTRAAPNPSSTSRRATTSRLDASEVSTISRRSRDRYRRNVSTFRPTRVTVSQFSAAQPIRARARATDDTAGITCTASRPSLRIKVDPIPDTSGSPDASATIDRPAWRASTSSRPASSGDGHGSRVAPESGTDARCRRPPSRTSARRTCARPAGATPAQPSAPMPTTVIEEPMAVNHSAGRCGYTRPRQDNRRCPSRG